MEIDKKIKTPLYKQLADNILLKIKHGDYKLDQKIPSVQDFCKKHKLSRETVFKALNLLSEKGIIKPFNRKGYFVQKCDINIDHKVFLMLDKMTPFKNEIYCALREQLSQNSEIEVYFHHGNNQIFKSILSENLNTYSYFVISTFLDYEDDEVISLLNSITPGKLILIDKFEKGIDESHSQIYQDFEFDIFESLSKFVQPIKNYKNVILLTPKLAPHKLPIIKGFKKFCKKFDIKKTILKQDVINNIEQDSLYIMIGAADDNLVKIIKFCRSNKYKLGKEIGVISYNDTQMKEILEDGITVISTDFKFMGTRVAEIINKGYTSVVEKNPSGITFRKSL